MKEMRLNGTAPLKLRRLKELKRRVAVTIYINDLLKGSRRAKKRIPNSAIKQAKTKVTIAVVEASHKFKITSPNFKDSRFYFPWLLVSRLDSLLVLVSCALHGDQSRYPPASGF